jgi:lysozyme family protein
MANIDIALKRTLKFEGGYVNDPHDPGGETNLGITKRVAEGHGYTGDMHDIPMSIVTAIYKQSYWDALKLDSITGQVFANHAFDCAVNMGSGTAAKMMQNTVNAQDSSFALVIDGGIGSKSTSAINVLCATTENERSLVTQFCHLRKKRYYDIIAKRPESARYINGWLKRCDPNT